MATKSLNTKSLIDASKETLIDTGVGLVGGGVLGAAMGKYSLIIGLPAAIYGAYKKNRWAKSIGMGMVLANGYQMASNPTNGLSGEEENYGMEGIDGFNLKEFQSGATTRIGNYFKGFKEKLNLLPAKTTTTSTAAAGLGEGEVTYFTNPYAGLNGGEEYTQIAGTEEAATLFGGGVIGSVGNLSGGASGVSGTGSIW